MTNLGDKYAMAMLKKKRASLDGEIKALQKQMEWKRGQLQTIDDAIHVFKPGADPSRIPPKRPHKRTKLFNQGELSRTVIDVLRREGMPLATAVIVDKVMAHFGHEKKVRPAFAPRVRSSLHYLERVREDVTKIGRGKAVTWTLTRFARPALVVSK